MIYGIYLSAAGAAVQDYKADVLANNLANIDTTGFKRDLAVFTERAAEARTDPRMRERRHPVQDEIGGGLFYARTATRFEPAALVSTGRPLDLALTGDGFFALRGPQGELRFTRAGDFRLNPEGEVVTADGRYRVLDAGLAPLALADVDGVSVGADGAVSRQGAVVGDLGVRVFADPASLIKEGGNLFRARDGDTGVPAESPGVVQGALEGSAAGARVMDEMVELIKGNRVYEMNLQALRMQDEILGQTVTRVGAVG